MPMPPLYCAPVESGEEPPTIVDGDQARAHHNASPLSDGEPFPFDNYRKRTRTLRFPCKARGVPDNHNARTAYIDIPPNAGHGAVVVCSHPVCAASGRKFRWCSVCMVPVAKRNFSKRHGHGLLCTPELPYVEVGEEGAEDDDASRGSKRQRYNSFNNYEMSRALEMIQDELNEEEEQEQEPKIPQTISVEATPPHNEAAIDSSVASSIDSVLTVQERRWLALFRNRPRPSNASEAVVRNWMAAILETAEFNTSNDSLDDGAMEYRDEETAIKQEEEAGLKEEQEEAGVEDEAGMDEGAMESSVKETAVKQEEETGLKEEEEGASVEEEAGMDEEEEDNDDSSVLNFLMDSDFLAPEDEDN